MTAGAPAPLTSAAVNAYHALRGEHLTEFNLGYPDGGGVPTGWAELSAGHPRRVGRVGNLTFWEPASGARARGFSRWSSSLSGWPGSGGRCRASQGRRVPATPSSTPTRGGSRGPQDWSSSGRPWRYCSQQAVLRWMLSGSTAAGKADIWFRWEWVPVWPLGAGLALLVLAAVWRRGVAMRSDLEGVV